MILKLHIAKPLEHLRTMLSESETMQELMGVDSAAAVLPRVYYGYAEDAPAFEDATGAEAVKALPRCLIALEDTVSNKETTDSWSTRVIMSVLLQVETLSADAALIASGRYEAFLKRIEGVFDDLRELAADNTRLNLLSLRTDEPPQRADVKESGGVEVWWCVFVVEAGG